ncbi:MAG: hypothetical protein R3B70_00525 [Polyangiaceae bacterium]
MCIAGGSCDPDQCQAQCFAQCFLMMKVGLGMCDGSGNCACTCL